MKYTDVAWDFDGTLFDSYPNCVRAFREMLNSFGVDEEPETIRREVVVTLGHAMRLFGAKYGLNVEEMWVRYRKDEGFRPDVIKPYPEVSAVLKQIKESGRRNHLYTNRNIDAVRYLDAYDLTRYFDGLITIEETGVAKPDPKGAFLLRDRYGIEPGKLLMVGDRELDLTAVIPAGFDGCFYNTNRLPVPECTAFTVDHLGELLKHL